MPTCTALMHTDCALRGQYTIRNTRRGFTFTELVVVVLIISLFVLLAVTNLSGWLRKSTFKVQAGELVSTMQMAASAAAESDKRYEVIIDITEQSYTLRQITSPQLPSDVLEEEIIVKNNFGANCRIVSVLFDDLVSTDEEHQKAFFRAGRTGWQAGGKIVLLDGDEQPYSVVVNRLSRIVILREGDVEPLMPKRQDEVPF
ncbi:MAG: prepilin-type N-terminal cleavage/methylation domain-containing protein [Phycisphaerae bacterium]|nr:prepilin-type N-terminal cleavage/methylation domain-containing protein [Phycisphaerae bacterium]MDD5381514.1 prepilin-type N-terminal cleavage/methylation domain-containing protein [Phycisphaerae bacterium]